MTNLHTHISRVVLQRPVTKKFTKRERQREVGDLKLSIHLLGRDGVGEGGCEERVPPHSGQPTHVPTRSRLNGASVRRHRVRSECAVVVDGSVGRRL